MTTIYTNRELWITAAAGELAKLYTQNNVEACEAFASVTRWSCSAPKSRRARVMSAMYKPSETESGERFEVFVRAEVSNEIMVLREVAINIHRIACELTGRRYTGFDAIRGAFDVFLYPGARREPSEWGFDVDRAAAWWADVGESVLGDYPHDQISFSAIDARRQNTRQLKILCGGCGFIARATWASLQRAQGTPVCACGTRTRLVNRDGTPATIHFNGSDIVADELLAHNAREARASAAQGTGTQDAVQGVELRAADVRVADLAASVQSEAGSMQTARQTNRAERRARQWSKRGENLETPTTWHADTPVNIRPETLRAYFIDPAKIKTLSDLFETMECHAIRYMGDFNGQPVIRLTLDGHRFFAVGSVSVTVDVETSHMVDDRPVRAPRSIREIALSPQQPSTPYVFPRSITGLAHAETPSKASKRWARVLAGAMEEDTLRAEGKSPEPRPFKVVKRWAKLVAPCNMRDTIPTEPEPRKVSKRAAKLELD